VLRLMRWWHQRRLVSGGRIEKVPPDDWIRVQLSDGRRITTPEEAEAVGLTADAKRMREGRF
jgi:hypothetical protein